MFGSSLPSVVSRRTDVLFRICLRIPGYLAGLIMLIFVVFSVLFCFVCYFVRFVCLRLVSNVASASGLSILYFPFDR